MLKPIDIMLVGVGGQGTILATKVLARVAQDAGYDIKVSEIKGMAQRGGSVVTQLRLGPAIHAPLISEGGADIILSFEKLEALRWLDYLKPGGNLIINDQSIKPVPVLIGIAEYPDDVLQYIESKGIQLQVVNALDIAVQCGNARTANVVLLAVLAKHMPLAKEMWQQALTTVVPEKFRQVNLDAFAAGYQL